MRFETLISAPPVRVFDLSLDVDAHVASTPGSRERAIAGVTTGVLGDGDEVTWQAWHLGLRFRMTSRITAYERPHRFVDEQVRGPFARFRHEHRFEPHADGTLMVDDIRFDAPFGPVGRLAERLVLDGHLRRLIETRNAILAEMAESTHA